MTTDHALITALVEGWRPETNTFHLPCGEATVTLEDVAYIYGLPIDGPAVTSKALYSTGDTAKLCKDLLQKVPVPKRDSIGTRINFAWMKEICKSDKKKKKKNEDEEKCKAMAYLFCLAGGQIVSNSTGTSAQAWLLSLFKEFKRYAWGPACLANLYRMLSKVAMLSSSGDENEDEKGKKFICSPYEEIIDKLTKVVHESDRNLFTSNTTMIFYWIVEQHNSERVMRQFGLRQMVPVPFQMPFDTADKVKKSLADYSISMKEIITIWETREKTVVRGESDASPTHEDSYMMWYALVMWLRIASPFKEKVDDEPLTPTHATKGDDELLTPTHATKGDDERLIPQS
ncbi:serine/threonine-protein phosphatase 7 long form [Cinnamomum micranthum f. kanehirae]|uniref:Serine/threonine-protein phosphatase 7 long form n=1 Tax=Cinnamomum micranthum f. kanehirae TaxID=337451 RepID=A0A443PRU5_9MAGN|nr:serine/threonine-protein phosphatase 7 long form [Cinnamomum micranthum f. kanehirae]